MKKSYLNRSSKKGVSLIEVIVAIFIITLISATATTFIISANKIEERNLSGVEVAIISENAVECFRFCEDDSSFLALLQKTDSFESKNGVIVLEKPTYLVVIDADFTLSLISIQAIDNGGKQIYSISYGK